MLIAALCIGLTGASSQTPDWAEVPFRIWERSLFVQVRLSGKPYWFMLDSGAYISWIDPKVARTIPNLKETKSEEAIGNNLAHVPSLEFGDAKLRYQVFVESRPQAIKKLSVRTPEPIVGGIGYNVLRMMKIGIDFHNQRLWAWSPISPVSSRDAFFGSEHPCYLLADIRSDTDLSPQVSFTIGGQTIEAMIDTGAHGLSVTHAQSKKIRSRKGPMQAMQRIQFVKRYRSGVATYASLGGVRWEYPEFMIWDRAEAVPALLGWTMFSPLGKVLFDFDGGKVYASHTGEISLFDSVLDLYGVYIDGPSMVLPDKRIALRDFKGIYPLPMNGPGDIHQRLTLSQAAQVRSSLLLQTPLVYAKGSGVGFSMLDQSRELGPVAKGLGNLDAEEVPFEAPGYYIMYKGKTRLLPAGVLWSPSSAYRVFAVGNLPPLQKLNKVGEYQRWRVPAVGDRVEELWNKMGLEKPESPVVYGVPVNEVKRLGWNSKAKTKKYSVPRSAAICVADDSGVFDSMTGTLRIK